jgi:hypothetical protein
LAFHPYPQLIRAVFNPQRFGPPRGITPASAWPWIDHSGFGSGPTDSCAQLRLAFASAPPLNGLTSPARSNSPDHNAKGTRSGPISPKGLGTLPPLVGTRFQVLFHPPPGVLFTFPSRYSFAIGHRNVFSLGRWSCQIRPGFHVSRPTQGRNPDGRPNFAYRALTSCGGAFQRASAHSNRPSEGPAGPSRNALLPRADNGCSLSRPRSLGSSLFARRYSGNHGCFLFLRVLRCFSSPGSLRAGYVFTHTMTGHNPGRVSPFGHPRINARLQLPVAFRSLPRPSSPSCAQASTPRPCRLIHSNNTICTRLTTPSRHSQQPLTPICQKAVRGPAGGPRTRMFRRCKWRAG